MEKRSTLVRLVSPVNIVSHPTSNADLIDFVEEEIIKCPLVEVSAIFGRERNQVGVLIELVKLAHGRLQTKKTRAQLMEEIWCEHFHAVILDLTSRNPCKGRSSREQTAWLPRMPVYLETP